MPNSRKSRRQCLPRVLEAVARAKALVFVLDSSAFARDIRDIAGFVYDVLVHPGLGRIPILFLCNKQDLFSAVPPGLVRTQLQTELSAIRGTRASVPLVRG